MIMSWLWEGSLEELVTCNCLSRKALKPLRIHSFTKHSYNSDSNILQPVTFWRQSEMNGNGRQWKCHKNWHTLLLTLLHWKKILFKPCQVTYQMNQHNKMSLNIHIKIQGIHYLTEFSKFYLFLDITWNCWISNITPTLMNKIHMKELSSKLILLYTYIQVTRQYTCEVSDSYSK